ncbi:WD40 repeat protein [Plasmopara halstedii]|uniref:WD40 repeat protein n=1 Tax=Plasmopara halstedii TaxID=4781 RepID=A0A0P1AXY8_PLAHL|nr:WD40 repeat protein [Plasmopara halstedii]CEG47153.1 WD40 repeat protein [Plasmopara halstedii]|eukprot:XP_024583522.1 WD40 repeat protein [Plasmopara halstedii]
MTWILPNEDAVTLGELNGELYNVSKKGDSRVGDEFIRRGGRVYSPARVTIFKPRPIGQSESLNDDQVEELDAGILRLLKRALNAMKTLLLDDELLVFNRVIKVAGGAMQNLLEATSNDKDLDMQQSARSSNDETIIDLNWHPSRDVLAVAQSGGVVTLYHVESASWDARVLEHPKQVDIGSIEWGKFTGNTLAVACKTGIFLWKVPVKEKEPELLEILKHPSNTGFSHVCWNADGSLLAAYYRGSKEIVLFDVIFSRSTVLQCSYNLSTLHWSPNSAYLFATTEADVSLMWETLTWKRETWEVAAEGCGWSNDGRCLLVGLRNSTLLYPYVFQNCPPSLDAQISSPALDFAEMQHFSLDRSASAIVGGKIKDIVWDPSGSRVAVTYRTSGQGLCQPGTSKLVAVFSVSWQPFLIFTRSGLLRGPPNAGVPLRLAFASTFKHGALLSVAWSSGLISFHPFYFKDPKKA